MAELRKAALLAAHNFQKWPVNPRVYVVFLLELAYVHWMVSPVGDFCAQGGYTVGPWVFPFLLAEPYSRLMVMLGLILLLCDAPFTKQTAPSPSPHMTAEQAGELARNAQVGALWISHLVPGSDEQAVLCEARKIFQDSSLVEEMADRTV